MKYNSAKVKAWADNNSGVLDVIIILGYLSFSALMVTYVVPEDLMYRLPEYANWLLMFSGFVYIGYLVRKDLQLRKMVRGMSEGGMLIDEFRTSTLVQHTANLASAFFTGLGLFVTEGMVFAFTMGLVIQVALSVIAARFAKLAHELDNPEFNESLKKRYWGIAGMLFNAARKKGLWAFYLVLLLGAGSLDIGLSMFGVAWGTTGGRMEVLVEHFILQSKIADERTAKRIYAEQGNVKGDKLAGERMARHEADDAALLFPEKQKAQAKGSDNLFIFMFNAINEYMTDLMIQLGNFWGTVINGVFVTACTFATFLVIAGAADKKRLYMRAQKWSEEN